MLTESNPTPTQGPTIVSKNLLPFLEQFSDPRDSMKMRMADKQWSGMKITGSLSLFPNESDVHVFRDMQTNIISWEDPTDIFSDEIKTQMEFCLEQKGAKMANCFFDVICDWCHQHLWIPFFPEIKKAKPFFLVILAHISKDMDVARRDKERMTPLMVAMLLGTEDTVVKLIQRCAKKEAVDIYGQTALHWGIYWGKRSNCRVLLENGANVHKRENRFRWNSPYFDFDFDGRTPLMDAVVFNSADIEMIKLLLEFGADPKMKQYWIRGKTAEDFAHFYVTVNLFGKYNAVKEIFKAHEAHKLNIEQK